MICSHLVGLAVTHEMMQLDRLDGGGLKNTGFSYWEYDGNLILNAKENLFAAVEYLVLFYF